MDVHKEFVTLVNESIKRKRQTGPWNRAGEEIVVIIPVPQGLSIDCNDTSGIDLDDVKICGLGDGAVNAEDGVSLLDPETARGMAANFYSIRGYVK